MTVKDGCPNRKLAPETDRRVQAQICDGHTDKLTSLLCSSLFQSKPCARRDVNLSMSSVCLAMSVARISSIIPYAEYTHVIILSLVHSLVPNILHEGINLGMHMRLQTSLRIEAINLPQATYLSNLLELCCTDIRKDVCLRLQQRNVTWLP